MLGFQFKIYWKIFFILVLLCGSKINESTFIYVILLCIVGGLFFTHTDRHSLHLYDVLVQYTIFRYVSAYILIDNGLTRGVEVDFRHTVRWKNNKKKGEGLTRVQKLSDLNHEDVFEMRCQSSTHQKKKHTHKKKQTIHTKHAARTMKAFG